MSVPILDYLPCDLTFYSQQVLPAWRAAHQGHFRPLRELMDSAHHFSCWPVFNIPNPFSGKFFAGPKCCFGWDYFRKDESIWPQLFSPRYFPPALREELLQEIEETQELNIWTLCSRHLPTLLSDHERPEPQAFLLRCLFYTFCCQLSSEEMADCREIVNEDVDLWEEYMARNVDVKALWGTFKQLAPQPLADQLLAPQTYKNYLTSIQSSPCTSLRALFGSHLSVTSFIDHQEAVYLLAHLPTNERSELNTIMSGCLRDYEGKKNRPEFSKLEQLLKQYQETLEHYYKAVFQEDSAREEQQLQEIQKLFCACWNEEDPQEFQKNVNRYYQALERMEKVMLSRFRYAAEHGWGMVEIWV